MALPMRDWRRMDVLKLGDVRRESLGQGSDGREATTKSSTGRFVWKQLSGLWIWDSRRAAPARAAPYAAQRDPPPR